MYIVNQTRSEITNVDCVSHINIDDTVISAYTVGNIRRVLGQYDNAPKVFQDLLNSFSTSVNVLYMPE